MSAVIRCKACGALLQEAVGPCARCGGPIEVVIALTGGAATAQSGSISVQATGTVTPAVSPILLSSVVERLGRANDGDLIQLVEPAWNAIIAALVADPAARFAIPDRKMEELIAASYKAAGYDEVILTPRSGDGGRDVIATRLGFARIRIIDQVKALADGRLVTANDVRALIGVLHADQNATKGMVTTTARFAPRIAEDSGIAPFVPYRLELIDGEKLSPRLASLRNPGK